MNFITRPVPSQLSFQYVGLRCLSKKLEFTDKDELKQMGNKARVIALRSERNAKKHTGFLKKVSEKKSGKVIPKYDIKPSVSVRDLSKITGAPLDFLLGEILSHVS